MIRGLERYRKYRFWGKTGTLDIHQKIQLLVSQVGKGPCTYTNFLIYEMSGHLDLLRNAPDGEYSQVGVGVGRGVPLQLHVGSRLLVYAFDVLAPCRQEGTGQKGEWKRWQTQSSRSPLLQETGKGIFCTCFLFSLQ